jgi:hypothetical protein
LSRRPPKFRQTDLTRALKGARAAQGQGIVVEKISGMYKPGADLRVPLMGRDLCVEVKARADGFRELYCWLNGRDVLIVKADRQEPLVVLRMSLAAKIARGAA